MSLSKQCTSVEVVLVFVEVPKTWFRKKQFLECAVSSECKRLKINDKDLILEVSKTDRRRGKRHVDDFVDRYDDNDDDKDIPSADSWD